MRYRGTVQVAEHLALLMHASNVKPDEDCLEALAAAAALAQRVPLPMVLSHPPGTTPAHAGVPPETAVTWHAGPTSAAGAAAAPSSGDDADVPARPDT